MPKATILNKSGPVTTYNEIYKGLPGDGSLKSLIIGFKNFFQFPKVFNHSENAKLAWLVRLRWMAISLFFLLAGPAYFVGALNRATMIVFIGIIGILVLVNIFTQSIFVESRHAVRPIFIAVQLAFDLAALTALLVISGGFENPFVGLFLVNAGLGGLLIRDRHSWPFLALCHAFLIALQIDFAINSFNIDLQKLRVSVIASHILLFSTWLAMRSLGSYLEMHFESLTATQVHTEKRNRLRAIGALAAGFSHEFASPLNAAKLRVERLEKDFEIPALSNAWYESAKKDVMEAKASIQDCETIIHAMNASQLDIRQHSLKPINMAEFIKDVTDSWLEEHSETKLKIENRISTDLILSPINLAQVIINLLDNAHEANSKAEIILTLTENDQGITLAVEDHGPGFATWILARKGEPFVTTKQDGTGLGLYVSEIFAESLGGHLSIENKPNSSGAIVTLRWPNQMTNVQV
ncbi:MAG: hypothetical protein J0L82_19080 [Deltaproteobacteria bacterium]|nr:hypothetical protein [Deltaproteobacteria bacterium]